MTLHLTSLTYSATLFYLSSDGLGENAAPVAPQETLKFLPGGGSFHIWVQPGTLLTGVSLDLQLTGSAVQFTGANVHNPMVGGDLRWLPSLIRHGTVTGTEVTRLEGGALVPLSGVGTGIGPATSGSDPMYESNAGFLFATVEFAVLNPGQSATVSLSIGHNLVSDANGLSADPICLGMGDCSVTNTPAATGMIVDLNLVARPLHPSDFNSDGSVDGRDLLIWQRGFGITSGATRSQGDATNDGRVDADDLVLWQSQYDTSPPDPVMALVVVPEADAFEIAICGAALGMISAIRRLSHSRSATSQAS